MFSPSYGNVVNGRKAVVRSARAKKVVHTLPQNGFL
jgi:hypothetical protein